MGFYLRFLVDNTADSIIIPQFRADVTTSPINEPDKFAWELFAEG